MDDPCDMMLPDRRAVERAEAAAKLRAMIDADPTRALADEPPQPLWERVAVYGFLVCVVAELAYWMVR